MLISYLRSETNSQSFPKTRRVIWHEPLIAYAVLQEDKLHHSSNRGTLECSLLMLQCHLFPKQVHQPRHTRRQMIARYLKVRPCLRCICTPLILHSQNPSLRLEMIDADPFSSSEEQMRLGYSFVIRPCTDRPQHLFQEAVLNRPTERKRKPKAEKMDSSSSSIAPPTKRRASKKKIKASDEPAQQTQLATHQQVSNLVSQADQAANAAMFNRMQHFQQLDPQQRLFLMNQQQQQQMMTMNPNMNVMQQQTPSNQPAQLQQQQQFEHLIQMRKQMATMKQNQQMQFVPTQNQPQGMNFNAQQQFVNQQMHPMQNNTGNNNIQQNTSGPIQHQQN